MGPLPPQAALDVAAPWLSSWAWSVPLIVLTVLIHSFCLLWVSRALLPIMKSVSAGGRHPGRFSLMVGTTVFLLTILHALEGAAWASAYRMLGALPDFRSATLYSLSAMTTYGHSNLSLAPHWEMMGALEALNGMILFGLTTAFLFAVIQIGLPIAGTGHERS